MPATMWYSMLRVAVYMVRHPVTTIRPAAMRDAWSSGSHSSVATTIITTRMPSASGARRKSGGAESWRALTSRKSRLYLCLRANEASASTSSVSPGWNTMSPTLPGTRLPSREIEMMAAP